MTSNERMREEVRKRLRHCAYKLAHIDEKYKASAVEELEEAAIAFAMACALCGVSLRPTD